VEVSALGWCFEFGIFSQFVHMGFWDRSFCSGVLQKCGVVLGFLLVKFFGIKSEKV